MYIVIITALSFTLFFNVMFCIFLVRAGARATCEIERLEKELQKIKSIASIRAIDLNKIKADAIEEAIEEVGQTKAGFEKPNAHKWMIQTDELREHIRTLRNKKEES